MTWFHSPLGSTTNTLVLWTFYDIFIYFTLFGYWAIFVKVLWIDFLCYVWTNCINSFVLVVMLYFRRMFSCKQWYNAKWIFISSFSHKVLYLNIRLSFNTNIFWLNWSRVFYLFNYFTAISNTLCFINFSHFLFVSQKLIQIVFLIKLHLIFKILIILIYLLFFQKSHLLYFQPP
jgi:hypothetical protein